MVQSLSLEPQHRGLFGTENYTTVWRIFILEFRTSTQRDAHRTAFLSQVKDTAWYILEKYP